MKWRNNGWLIDLQDSLINLIEKNNTLDKLEYGYYSLPVKHD